MSLAHRLDFSHVHSYAASGPAIAVPIALRSGPNVVDLVANLDTGASDCLFEGSYAKELGLDLTRGVLQRFRTANSTFEAFGHEVDAFGILTRSTVYFFADRSLVKNVLGRRGWLDRVRLGIVDYDHMLYLAAHSDSSK